MISFQLGDDGPTFACTGGVCSPNNQSMAALFFNVQAAINRGAATVGISERAPVTGVIGPETADVAFRVVLKAPKDSIVGGLVFNDRVANKAEFARELSTNPMFYFKAFNELAGVPDLPIQAPPVPPIVLPPILVPVPVPVPGAPAPATSKKSHTTRNVLIAVGATALVGGIAGAVVYGRSKNRRRR